MRAAELAERLPGAKRHGTYFMVACPSHDDGTPSLSFRDGDTGILFKCHAGCAQEIVMADVAALIHCELHDFFFGSRNGQPEPTRFSYTDHEGEVVYQIVKDPATKQFKARRPDNTRPHGWAWDMKGIRPILYNLPELLDAPLVLVVEGERDVETLREWGLVATTHPFGAKAFKPMYAEQLQRAMDPKGLVAVLRDEDEPGRDLQRRWLAGGHAVGLTMKLIELPHLPAMSGADITDWKGAGHEKPELLAIIEHTPIWTPQTPPPDVEAEILAAPFGGDPEPVPTALLPVPAFPLALLPEAFEPWVRDIAERMQCPPDYAAVAAIVSAASVIGRQVGIRPRVKDDWTVVPNLWGQAIGPPGGMKTPALTQAMKPLRWLVAKARERYAEALKNFPFEEAKLEAQKKMLTKQIQEALAESKDVEHLREAFAALGDLPKPVQRRYETNDATVEKLAMMMNENPNGLLLYVEELPGFHRTFDREGHQGDRAFWDTAWNGDQSISVDRVGRGELYVPACCGSILGSIQPGPLEHVLREVFANGRANDGFPQRFQVSVWPDLPRTWTNVERWPDTEARKRVYTIFEGLADLDLTALGAQTPPFNDQALPFVKFTAEAQAEWDGWYAALQQRLRQPGDEHPVMLNHLAKYPKLVASLALVSHLIDCVATGTGGFATEAAILRAIAWVTYLEAHARRMYECVSDPGRVATATLAAKIQAGALPRPFTARQVSRKGWTTLTEPNAVMGALEQLERLHWVRPDPQSATVRGGRPTVFYQVHPKVTKEWPRWH